MNRDDFISDEQLSAFLDDELDAEEKSRIFSLAERDPELDRRICHQRKIRELVRHAYHDVPRPERRSTGVIRRRPLAYALVASVLVLIGLGAGLLAPRLYDQGNPAASPGTLAVTESPNYILHVSSGEPDNMRAVLKRAREILASSDQAHPHRVEVVANEQGLNLLRSDITPFAEEIAALADSSVVFYACSRAIQRLEERGVSVQLVPQANPDYTALDRVVLRLQDGWNYLKL
jgi:intracellular sulfur oxidation DsrE/DsrF family protein